MTRAVLDTNVLVQSTINPSGSGSSRVLDAYYDGRFQLLYSPATLDEVLDVLLLPDIRERHGLSDDEVLEFIASLLPGARRCEGTRPLSHALTRDVTDTKFLAVAEEGDADYLVTNDRGHLLRLKRYGRTKIVTPAEFLRLLS